ncbi:hypothetical protein SAMN05216464_11312 [Mucilaginibacter pineti]|uniref:DUF5045 domain-containing protein n=1 Tax=Mucilaginibacter pineti TaxID=1391627 RepID=A0A1G7IFJ7_9SPHI|nr:hypothetical protein [Mucilaginibacter pineti]SDF11487.1 hypothetical protein SAMN05216464_11312 [Mucilaginibacter pineti]
MKRLIFSLLFCGWAGLLSAQMIINDQSIRYQQERMVFKQWDKNKFTPKPGFLYTNPLYWLTWAWHTDYKNHDLRPLSATGPQTQRLALVLAMQNTDNAYALHADTLGKVALGESMNYSGLLSDADPLWLLYYRHQFDPLLSQQDNTLLDGLTAKERSYLTSSGLLTWYQEESHALAERLNAARATTVDRGSRLIAYHRMLDDFRKLEATWETKKQRAKLFLSLSDSAKGLKSPAGSISLPPGKTDQQIADEILLKSKL